MIGGVCYALPLAPRPGRPQSNSFICCIQLSVICQDDIPSFGFRNGLNVLIPMKVRCGAAFWGGRLTMLQGRYAMLHFDRRIPIRYEVRFSHCILLYEDNLT